MSFHKNYDGVNDPISTLIMLFAGGGVSLIINDEATISYRTKEAGVDYAALERMFEIPELNTKMHVAFSLKTPVEIVARFSAALEKMKTDGTSDAIWEKYRSNPQYP